MTDTLVDYIKANKPKVYTVLNHVSQSGMSRTISMYIILDNDLRSVHHLLSDYKRDHKRGGIKVTGCGMDMGYHLVNSLSWTLFNKGRELKHEWL